MLASFLIIGFSLVLLVYWFRYTCLLLLRNPQIETANASAPSTLSHVPVLQSAAGMTSLDPLHQALNRDYAVINYVLRHAADITLNPIERYFLGADYRLMGFWYRLTRATAPASARQALEEMSSILCFLERRMGRQTA